MDIEKVEWTYTDAEDPSVDSSWSIKNTQDLEWALKRDADLRAEANEIEQAADAAKRKIDARKEYLLTRLHRGVEYFESHIAKYATGNRDALLGGSAKKSRTFLNGTVGWRKRSGRLVVVDDDALRKWLAAQADTTLYRIKIEPEMKALQDAFKATGVIPPGMEYVTEIEKLYIEPVNLLPPKGTP